ncbi:MAG: O-antigen ligase family protein [Methylomicrobium sp.]|nr:O-antigen ligase family protein [Methylomicrobium sp.]
MNPENRFTDFPTTPSWRDRLMCRHVELLVILFVVVQPFGEIFLLPLIILLLLSLNSFYREGIRSLPNLSLYVGVSLLLTVPLLIASVSAYKIDKTLITALYFMLYTVAGVYVIRRFAKSFSSDFLFYGVAAILIFWTFDALIQYFVGHNLFGWPYNGYRLTGIFHPKMRIGIIFAHLSPFLIEAGRRLSQRSGHNWHWLFLAPFLAVVLLSGSRSAWLTLLVVSFVYFVILLRHRAFKVMGQVLLLLSLSASVSVLVSESLQVKLTQTVSGFSTDPEALNEATSLRIDVWRGAWQLFLDSPVTGVGVKALGDLGFQRGYTPMPFGHAHFYGLDVLMVTGIIGFVAYLIAFGLVLWKAAFSVWYETKAFPFWLAAGAMMLPLNMHWEFYGVRSIAWLWMLIFIAFATEYRYQTETSTKTMIH